MGSKYNDCAYSLSWGLELPQSSVTSGTQYSEVDEYSEPQAPRIKVLFPSNIYITHQCGSPVHLPLVVH
jgi:hypothetical protein